MSQATLVSVITPTYKRPKLLDRAIDSVLNQTYDRIEVIVVDDNNENTEYRRETEKLMERYNDLEEVKYIKHQVNKNGAAARNTGIRNSKGEYIAFLDDDDEFLPRKIELQVNKIECLGKEWGGIYSGFIRKIGDEVVFERKNIEEGDLTKEILLRQLTLHAGSTLMVKRGIIEELNGFDESFIRHQDLELLLRFFRKYKLAGVNKKLSIIHKGEVSTPNAKNMREIKVKFLDKFQSDIESFSKDVQRKIYRNHLLDLSKAFFREGNINEGISFYKKAKEYSKINWEEKIVSIVNLADGFFPVRERLRILYSKIRNSRI